MRVISIMIAMGNNTFSLYTMGNNDQKLSLIYRLILYNIHESTRYTNEKKTKINLSNKN